MADPHDFSEEPTVSDGAKVTHIELADFCDELGKLLAREGDKTACPACGERLRMGGNMEHPFVACTSCPWGICPCRKREPA